MPAATTPPGTTPSGSTPPERTPSGATPPGTAPGETTHPKPTHPGSTRSEPTHPETAHPEPTLPGSTHPGWTQPETAHLEPTLPGSTQPESTQPEPTHPEPTRSGPTPREPAQPETTRSRPLVAITVLASCGLLVSLVQTMVVPLLPQFPQLLSVSPSTASWLITANLVAGAVSAPVLGRLGDMYGKRRMLLVALALVGLGSLIGALAPGIGLMLLGRVLQGTAFGVIALGMSLMRDVLPSDRVASGVGLMSASLGFGGAIGLPVTGVVAQFLHWRWLFAGAAVIAVLQIVLVARLVPESRLRAGGRFDVVGAIGISGALVCLLLAVSKGNDWGPTSPVVLGLAAGAVVLALSTGRYELRTPAPLIDLRVAARPAVLLTNLASVMVGFAMFAGFVLATQILQAPVATGYGFGLSLIVSGLVLLPMGVSMMVFSSVSARVSRARGPRTTLVMGTVLLGVGNLVFATVPGSVWLLTAVATVAAIGAALAYSAIPLLIMRAVPESETAAANSLNTLARQLGTSSCTAVVAAVTSAMVLDVGGSPVPAREVYVVSFAVAGIVALVGTVVVLLTPAPTPSATAEPEPARTA